VKGIPGWRIDASSEKANTGFEVRWLSPDGWVMGKRSPLLSVTIAISLSRNGLHELSPDKLGAT
jgi:hypothetical protein